MNNFVLMLFIQDLRCPQTGVSTEGGETHSSILEGVWGDGCCALGSKSSVTPPLLIQSGSKDVVDHSLPSVAWPSDMAPRNRNRKRRRGPFEIPQ